MMSEDSLEQPSPLKVVDSYATGDTVENDVVTDIEKAAKDLFDNRLGWSDERPPCYAPRSFWAKLGVSLYGEDDPRVKELNDPP